MSALLQGTEEWHEHRAQYFNASEAPAMMGCSPYMSRDELIAIRATGIQPEHDEFTLGIFEKGHRFEALARPLAEKYIGGMLSPVTVTEGEYSASLDGATFTGEINFEHKTLNDSIRDVASAEEIPLHYRVQMEQQHLCSGAEKTLFMASDWDESENPPKLIDKRWFWYYPDIDLQCSIVAGWQQFAEDVKNYKPSAPVKQVIAEPVNSDLPMPVVIAKGEIAQNNLAEITPKFDSYLAAINTELTTDQQFADAEGDAKNCRKMAKKLQTLSDGVVAQMVEVQEVTATLADYKDKLNKMGLRLEKLVKAEKENIKSTAILGAKSDLRGYLDSLESLKDIGYEFPVPDFANAIKGVRLIESMKSRINDALAASKVEANTRNEQVRARLAYIDTATEGYTHLFNRNDLALRDMDYLQLHVKSVIDDELARVAEIERQAEAAAEAKRVAEKKAEEEAAEKQRLAEMVTEDKKEPPQVEPTPKVLQEQAPADIGGGFASSPYDETGFTSRFSMSAEAAEKLLSDPLADDAEIYVCVIENDEPSGGGDPIVWEHPVRTATLEAAQRMKEKWGDKYGRTRIAKLVWVD